MNLQQERQRNGAPEPAVRHPLEQRSPPNPLKIVHRFAHGRAVFLAVKNRAFLLYRARMSSRLDMFDFFPAPSFFSGFMPSLSMTSTSILWTCILRSRYGETVSPLFGSAGEGLTLMVRELVSTSSDSSGDVSLAFPHHGVRDRVVGQEAGKQPSISQTADTYGHMARPR